MQLIHDIDIYGNSYTLSMLCDGTNTYNFLETRLKSENKHSYFDYIYNICGQKIKALTLEMNDSPHGVRDAGRDAGRTGS